MRPCRKRLSLTLLAGSIGVACSVALLAVALAQEAAALPPQMVAEPKPQPPATPQCEVNLRNAGQMKDVISNVLIRAEHKPESEVAAFLKDAERRYATGDDLLKAAAEHFKIDQKRLAPLVEHWRHINCKPEHAVSAISARVKSLMIEADEVPRDQWAVRGEHDNDARRAYQIAALAIAADKEKYAGVAGIVGMSEETSKRSAIMGRTSTGLGDVRCPR
jgi:hypothetical protein